MTIADIVDYGGETGLDDKNGAYNPEQFPGKFAGDVEASITERNSTRRDLHECADKNPIDKCWRCKADWADNREALTQCVIGFGAGTTGGAGGEVYTVTDCSDDTPENPKQGTLRHAACQKHPTWIIFDKDMVITLKHALPITSDTTIDGRGTKVEIAFGAGISVHTVKNVIIHGINIHDTREMPGYSGRSGCDGDAIAVKTSSNIWVDHCTFSGGIDGLLDVTVGSTAVTLSNNKFSDHDKVMLLGADDSHTEDKIMLATVAYNKFDQGCVQRMPRCRHGFFQVVNNDYNKWGMYAIGGSAAPTILSQGNKFLAPDEANKKNVLQRANAQESEWKNWNWRTDSNDVFENGAIFKASGSDPQLTPEQQAGMIPVEPGTNVPQLTSCVGALSCVIGQPC
uniref:pectate lyase 1-like n=1 Tax=Erigeron canadensis TaxID=72917 RepID=UPI001CB8A833|nr:pectate lyase 1-like [Erigeron canadensis]